MSTRSVSAHDIADRTETGRSALEAGEHSPDNGCEAQIADALIWLAFRRSQVLDEDAVVAFLDSLRDGSSPLIGGPR